MSESTAITTTDSKNNSNQASVVVPALPNGKRQRNSPDHPDWKRQVRTYGMNRMWPPHTPLLLTIHSLRRTPLLPTLVPSVVYYLSHNVRY
jgi:hypothetical protein